MKTACDSLRKNRLTKTRRPANHQRTMDQPSKNRLRLDYAENPELQALLGAKAPGESGALLLAFTVLSNDENGIVVTTDRLREAPEGMADAEPEADEQIAEPDESEPIMAAMIGRAEE